MQPLSAAPRLEPSPPIAAPSPSDSQGSNPYQTLVVSPGLGEMKSITLRTLLLEVGARDTRNLDAALVAELKTAGFIHLIPESQWSQDRAAEQAQHTAAVERLKASLAAEAAAKKNLETLIERRDSFTRGALTILLGKLPPVKRYLDAEASRLHIASIESSRSGVQVRDDETAANALLAKASYLNTFGKFGDFMIGLSEVGKQVAADLRNETDLPFSAFAASKLQESPVDPEPRAASISSSRARQLRFTERMQNGGRWKLSTKIGS